MSGPQKENGFTPIANEILDVVARLPINATQFRILMVVWRYTYGFNRKQHELSQNFIAEATGLHKKQIQRELNNLIKINVINIEKEATFSSPRILKFNKYHDSWVVAKQLPPNKKDTHTGNELVTQERQYKDNIKEIDDDDLGTDQDDIPVADAGAIPAQQEESDLIKIEQNYAQKLSRSPSSKDLQAMLQVYEEGYPADFIIRCIDIGCERYRKANGKVNIKSFKYFIPIIEDEWAKQKAREEAEKATPGAPPAIQPKKENTKPKRTRFSNFEQQTSKYSADELEKLFRDNV